MPANPEEKVRQHMAEVVAMARERAPDVAALFEPFVRHYYGLADADDVVSLSDGGGVVRATRIPVVGAVTVAKYIHAFAARFWEGTDLHQAELNGEQAIVVTRDGAVYAFVTAAVDRDGIHRLFWVLNPSKLEHLAAV